MKEKSKRKKEIFVNVNVAKNKYFEIWDDKNNQMLMIDFLCNATTIGLDYEDFEELKECLKQAEGYNWSRCK